MKFGIPWKVQTVLAVQITDRFSKGLDSKTSERTNLNFGCSAMDRVRSSPVFRRVCKIAKIDYELRLVCPYVRMEQVSSHWTDFHEILCFCVLPKICRENSSFIKNLRRITGRKRRTGELWNRRRESQIETKLDQPTRKNGQHQTSETRPELQT